jgi:hypothetical protein
MINQEQREKLIEADRIKNISLIEDFTDECMQRNCFDFGNADELLTDLTANILSSTESKWVSDSEIQETALDGFNQDNEHIDLRQSHMQGFIDGAVWMRNNTQTPPSSTQDMGEG